MIANEFFTLTLTIYANYLICIFMNINDLVKK